MKALKRIKVGKAAGYDRISSDMLRSGRGIVTLQSIYRGSSACIRINGAYTDWFYIRKGVRQGCVASPWLFNLFMDSSPNDLKEYECGGRMDELSVKCLLYADD
ncbi:hypothetical protein EVAR_3642_1 [Eumeta japonica]|uniref:Reverse transcriptase domain-containing protein n=1 Tax=Eumeta variegata TaxID=151549 RepID=A0A4C1SVR4_EUMVA|nr:hypothetical protein EVAR_3642_1 [Eumeta japonica]